MPSSESTWRLAILNCDTPIAPVLATNGTYTDIFKTLLDKSVPEGQTFTLDAFDVVTAEEYPQYPSQYHTIILSGAVHSAYDSKPWINKLVQFVANTGRDHPNIKLVGICFGHQIIARAFGGECVPNGGKWEVGVTEVKSTDLGARLLGSPSFNIHQMHRDHVPALPPTFELLGSTSVSEIQGMVKFGEHRSKADLTSIRVIAFQGHPEFTTHISSSIIAVRNSAGIINDELAADATKRMELRNDGVDVMARAVWGVLGAQKF